MMSHNHAPTMSQKIFSSGLNTQTISVYLLCCGLADAGDLISEKNLKQIWNGTPKALWEGLNRLKACRIIRQINAADTTGTVFRIAPDTQWHKV